MDAEERATQIWAFIRDYRRVKGYSPSVREIRDGVGISSTSITHRWLRALAERGMITWEWGKGRTIRAIGEG